MSHIMRKPVFRICNSKGADQLHSQSASLLHLLIRKYDPCILKLKFSNLLSLVGDPRQIFSWRSYPSSGDSNMSHIMRKPTICIGENKETDQLCGNHEADQRLCFRYTDSSSSFLNPKFQASSHLLCLYSSICVEPVWKPHCWFSQDAAPMYRPMDLF